MELIYPASADNGYKKYYVCYRLQERLRVIHNNWGAKFRNKEITAGQWADFKRTWYEPRMNLVIAEILRLRALAKRQTWNINLSNVFVNDEFVYPASADDGFKKFAFCFRVNQKLRNVYKNWNDKFINNEITEDEWNTFRDDWYQPREDLVSEEIGNWKQTAKNQTWSLNLTEIFV